VLGHNHIDISDNFFALGGDSLQVVQIAARAKEYGLNVSPRDVFMYQTISELAKIATVAIPLPPEKQEAVGPVPLTPIQRRFLERFHADPHHRNSSTLLKVHPSINIDRLESALKAIIQHHDALRLRVCRDGSNYTQYVVEMSDAPVLEVFDLSNFMPSDQVSRIREIGISMQASFRFDGSPLFKAAFLNYGFEAPGRLIVLAHHLIMDEYSFGILMADLVRTMLNRGRLGTNARTGDLVRGIW